MAQEFWCSVYKGRHTVMKIDHDDDCLMVYLLSIRWWEGVPIHGSALWVLLPWLYTFWVPICPCPGNWLVGSHRLLAWGTCMPNIKQQPFWFHAKMHIWTELNHIIYLCVENNIGTSAHLLYVDGNFNIHIWACSDDIIARNKWTGNFVLMYQLVQLRIHTIQSKDKKLECCRTVYQKHAPLSTFT